MNMLKLVNWRKKPFDFTYGPNLVKLTRLNHRYVWEFFLTKIWYGKTLSCRTSLKSGTAAAVPAVPAAPPMEKACTQNANTHALTWGYWRQRAEERLGDLPSRWIQEPLVVTDRDRRPPKGPTGSALLLCVAGVHCWDLLGVSRSMERNRHLLSIYPRIIASIHCISSLIRDIFMLLYSTICWCVLVALVQLSVLAKWLAGKTHLMTSSCGEEITTTKPRLKRLFVCIFLSFGLFMLLCVFPGPTQHTFHCAYGTI